MVGDDLNQVLVASREVEKIMASTLGTVNVDNPLDKPRVNLHIHINREKAVKTGASIQAIDEVIRASLVGTRVSQFRGESGEDYPILVRYQGQTSLNEERRPRPE